jgi:ribosomal protein S18 acetylase RimI-like enzyme
MNQITLRPVTPDDDDFVLELYASTRGDLAEMQCDAITRAQLIRMQCHAQQQHYRAAYPRAQVSLVLDQDGTRVGRIYVDRAPHEIRLVDISLLPQYRRRGIGQQLLQNLMEEGERAGLPVRLSVMAGNPASHLYQRLGFGPGTMRGAHQLMEWRGASGQAANDLPISLL